MSPWWNDQHVFPSNVDVDTKMRTAIAAIQLHLHLPVQQPPAPPVDTAYYNETYYSETPPPPDPGIYFNVTADNVLTAESIAKFCNDRKLRTPYILMVEPFAQDASVA